jgi:hypothetical protein
MFVSTPENFSAIKQCIAEVQDSRKPLVFWIGAGASAWRGLPLWPQLADRMYRRFQSCLTAIQRTMAQNVLLEKQFPAFFSLCKAQDSQLYFRTLLDELKTPVDEPRVYARFISAIRTARPPLIVTTNVDQCLEQGAQLPSVLYGDIEQVMRGQYPDGCILKLHGCTSVVTSLIFAEEDYKRLLGQTGLLSSLEQLFSSRTGIFIGSSIGDQYVLDTLKRAHAGRPLLGSGPHFCVLPFDSTSDPGEPVRCIRYDPKPHPDHRSCIQIVEEINRSREAEYRQPDPRAPVLRSATIISELLLPGTQQTSQTAELTSPDGKKARLEVGSGFVESELPHSFSTAMHDAVVGLLTFDEVVVPSAIIGKLLALLGEDTLRKLVSDGILRFVHFDLMPSVFFPDNASITGGRLINVRVFNQPDKPVTLQETLEKQIKPVPGKEREASALISSLLDCTNVVSMTDDELLPLIRSVMLLPSIRSMLGFSDLVSLDSIPNWLVFPILRLASVVRIGATCRKLGLASAKLEFGNDLLAGPVFTAAFGRETVERPAAYVATGSLSGDLGAFVTENPGALSAILRFRETYEGSELRKAVLQRLALSEGGEVVAAINGRLSEMLPLYTLEKAKSKFSELYVPSSVRDLPAIFLDYEQQENPFLAWRRRSGAVLSNVCRNLNIGRNSLCPCGSGERFKFCCEPLVQT